VHLSRSPHRREFSTMYDGKSGRAYAKVQVVRNCYRLGQANTAFD
jgi:hypothetical protein